MISFVIFVAGCKQGNVDENPSPYVGGEKGLGISFEAAAPLAEFTQDDIVDVKVKLVNQGESELLPGSAKIKLYGVSSQEFNTLNFDYFTVVEGLFPAEKGIYEEGGQIAVDMGDIDYNGQIGTSFIERNLFAKVCYPYQTKANVDACITSQRIEQTGAQSTCSLDGEKVREGYVSSGPIQITSFTEELRGVSEIIFRIGIQNKKYVRTNEGQVFSKDAECESMESSSGSLQNEGKVYVKVLPENILCSFSNGQYNEGFITLNGNEEKVLVCTMVVEGTSRYTQGIDILLDYNYLESTSTKIKILGNQ